MQANDTYTNIKAGIDTILKTHYVVTLVSFGNYELRVEIKNILLYIASSHSDTDNTNSNRDGSEWPKAFP